MVQIKLPDGSIKEYHEGISPREIAAGIGKRLADAAVAATAGGRVVDLDRPLEDGTDGPIELRILTPKDREALDVYLRRLGDGGVVAFHISNVHVDLQPVLANLARDRGLAGLVRHDKGGAAGKAATSWAVLARDMKDLEALRASSLWEELAPDPAVGVWTDDYSNLLAVFKWNR